MKQKSKLGFSLIELSVVILVIGLLVLGVAQGSRIISQAKLRSAQALTAGSPVNSMSNLALWVETTSDKSFDAAVTDGVQVANWYDLNSQSSKNNATQSNGSLKPTYYSSRINSLPAVNFNSHYLNFDGTTLIGTNYTIFVVEQRRSTNSNMYFIGGNGTGSASNANTNLHIGYLDGTTITLRQFFNDCNTASGVVTAYSSPIARIHSFRFGSSVGKNYSLNGTGTSISCATPTQGLVGFPGAAIGARTDLLSNSYIGDIGEVIIFTKYLSNSERQTVEGYLSQKWGVKLS